MKRLILSVIAGSVLVFGCHAKESDIDTLRETGRAFVQIAKSVTPAVVSIRAEQTVQQQMPDFSPFEFFFGPQFRQPRPQSPRQRRQMAQGSGFIISEDGFIFTNNHVVNEAETILVTLKDGREFEAELVGTDPETEIALIRIHGENLPAAPLGNSDTLEVGEWALAIGNPFGLQETVTIGIISATGRSRVGITDFENFIQTDAAINPGNSGGPLLNIEGEVIGINTAIYSRSGGYMGIGFAIPINMAKDIKETLIEHGRVQRSLIGVYLQTITPELAEGFGLESTDGVLISQVVEGQPAEKSGIQPGDIVLELNGNPVGELASFRNRVAAHPPGTEITLTVLRNGELKEITLVTEARDSEKTASAGETEILEKAGIRVMDLTNEQIRRMQLPPGTAGVQVEEVEPGSPAWRGGLREGMVIRSVNRVPVANVADFYQAVRTAQKNTLLLLVQIPRHGARYMVIRLD